MQVGEDQVDEDQVDEDPAIRLRLAIDLHEVGVAMRRQQLVRAMPGASATGVDDALGEWLRARPGAPRGDTWAPAPPR